MPKVATKILLCTALVTVLALSAPASLLAQGTTPDKTEKADKKTSKSETKSDAKSDTTDAKTKEAKPLTPQQQKMKDCGAKWQEEKKTKGISGKAAYQKFLSTCLKS